LAVNHPAGQRVVLGHQRGSSNPGGVLADQCRAAVAADLLDKRGLVHCGQGGVLAQSVVDQLSS
jgi:hypothetical protein